MAKARLEDPFENPDRDERIASGEIPLDPRYLRHVNKSELVQLCNLIDPGCRANRGTSDSKLLSILDRSGKQGKNVIDRYRKLIKAFVEVNWKKIQDQIDPRCDGDCYKCHDVVVLSCYIVNAERLQKFRAKRSIKEK